MGSSFVGPVLVSMFEQPAKAPAEAELAPIRPAAWAAWAESYAREQAAKPAGQVPVAPSGDLVRDSRSPRLVPGAHHG